MKNDGPGNLRGRFPFNRHPQQRIMPYRWSHPPDTPPPGQSIRLDLWPHRSLPRRGFVWVIGLTAGGLALPMLAVTGTTAMWGLLPFALAAIWALWFAIQKSYASGRTHEVFRLSRESLVVTRRDPGHPDRTWRTNPYWVRPMIRHDGPVEDYLTLTDGQREIELGAFLSPEERRSLQAELSRALARPRDGMAAVR